HTALLLTLKRSKQTAAINETTMTRRRFRTLYPAHSENRNTNPEPIPCSNTKSPRKPQHSQPHLEAIPKDNFVPDLNREQTNQHIPGADEPIPSNDSISTELGFWKNEAIRLTAVLKSQQTSTFEIKLNKPTPCNKRSSAPTIQVPDDPITDEYRQAAFIARHQNSQHIPVKHEHLAPYGSRPVPTVQVPNGLNKHLHQHNPGFLNNTAPYKPNSAPSAQSKKHVLPSIDGLSRLNPTKAHHPLNICKSSGLRPRVHCPPDHGGDENATSHSSPGIANASPDNLTTDVGNAPEAAFPERVGGAKRSLVGSADIGGVKSAGSLVVEQCRVPSWSAVAIVALSACILGYFVEELVVVEE
ncbi:MAG: hypothetical protein Q9164_002808, partial [Protoblastenia rupestris]